jgi:hypothetical protein
VALGQKLKNFHLGGFSMGSRAPQEFIACRYDYQVPADNPSIFLSLNLW